ncbi:MAG: LysM peptidoglycan-binding domain-containing protein [Bacteroidetes bacterium]|nr:LysM peptidoglycan-binding domain-containing protein [Bacteroidota bacterium]
MKSFFFLLFMLAIFFFFFIPDTYANINYTVKKGDNLYTISKKFNVPVSDIKQNNNLSTNKLDIGDKLSIPKANRTPTKKHTEQQRNISAPASTSNAQPADPFEVRYHQVKKGETLDKIARKYSLNTKRIMEINGLTSKKIKPGQQLLVKAPKPDAHIVKKGDTIWSISVKYNLTPDELKDINGLQDNSLKLGQRLLLAKKNAAGEESIQSAFLKLPTDTASNKIEEVKILSKSDELADLSMRERLIVFAKKMLHLPYRFGGSSPFGIDCSAYVQKVYGFIGLDLPRTAREQFRFGEGIDKEELSVGDLVFFRTYASFPSHVGIYLGNNLFIHASSRNKRVTIDSLDTPYYVKRFIGAKRIISEEDFLKSELPERLN